MCNFLLPFARKIREGKKTGEGKYQDRQPYLAEKYDRSAKNTDGQRHP